MPLSRKGRCYNMSNMSDAVITFPMFGEGFSLSFSNSFSLFGHEFYWYGVIIAVGFLLAVGYALRRSKDFGLTQDNIIDMLIIAVPLAIVLARLYYVVFNFAEYRDDPITALYIWKGGLAIYGGVIGGVLGVIIFCRWRKIPVGAMLDVGSMGLLIGQGVGRWGNFANREAYGGMTDIFCRMGLTREGAATIYVHPTFLYESLWNFAGLVLLHFFSKKCRKYDGQVFALYVAWYGLGRFFIEGLRTDSLYLPGSTIRVSQLLAIVSMLAALLYLLRNHIRGNKTPDMLFVNVQASKIQVNDADEAVLNVSEDEEKCISEDETAAGEDTIKPSGDDEIKNSEGGTTDDKL